MSNLTVAITATILVATGIALAAKLVARRVPRSDEERERAYSATWTGLNAVLFVGVGTLIIAAGPLGVGVFLVILGAALAGAAFYYARLR